MSKVFNGRAVLHGADGQVTGDFLVSGSAAEVKKVQISRNYNQQKIKNRLGQTMTIVSPETVDEVTVTVIPVAGTGNGENTLAHALAAFALPAAGDIITLDFSGIDVLDGDWNVMDSQDGSLDGENPAELTLKLQRFDGAPLDAVT